MKTGKGAVKLLILFLIGGGLYYTMELLWRGQSHSSMFLLGGVCFVLVGQINQFFPWELGFVWQCLIGAALITGLELVTGLIVNLWLGLNVWDYSQIPLNFMGQVCLPFSLLWIFLAGAAILLDDYLRYQWFHESKPDYTLLRLPRRKKS